MFYTYSQNNSGGSFVNDDKRGICEYVIVEAFTATDADERARQIGLYFDGRGDCRCCGNRWYEAYGDLDATEFPSIYGDPLDEVESDGRRKRTFVHYLDGRVEEVAFKEKTT